eukprot:349893-Chlamydomonas_euryale.AAC.7
MWHVLASSPGGASWRRQEKPGGGQKGGEGLGLPQGTGSSWCEETGPGVQYLVWRCDHHSYKMLQHAGTKRDVKSRADEAQCRQDGGISGRGRGRGVAMASSTGLRQDWHRQAEAAAAEPHKCRGFSTMKKRLAPTG